VCLFTDGFDTASKIDANAMVKRVVETGVRVFVIRTPTKPGSSFQAGSGAAEAWMRSVTEATGGSVLRLDASRGSKPSRGLPSLYEMLEHAYRVELSLPGIVDKPQRLKLWAADAGGSKRKDVRLIYPELVGAPPSP